MSAPDTDYRYYTTAELAAMPEGTHMHQEDLAIIMGYVDWYKSAHIGRWQTKRTADDGPGWVFVISNSELSRRKLRRIDNE